MPQAASKHFEHTLDNGLTILAEPISTSRSFACGLFVRTGTRDEPRRLNGVSHFLEHMMFKGSDSRDAAEMNQIFDDLGANYNAFTTQEMTGYHAAVLPEFTKDVMEHLGHLFRPALRNDDFDTEKQVILEEIAMYADDPGHRVFEEVMARHYEGHPLEMSILGPAETIGGMARDDMKGYLDQHYGPRNTVLSVAGQFDFDEIVRLAQEHYGHWQPVGFERELSPAESQGGVTHLVDPKLTRRYVMGLSNGPSAQHDDRYAARVLADLIGDGDGSRLYWALVDPAICEEAELSPYPHDRVGSFALSLTCDPDKSEQATDIALGVLRGVKDDLGDDEIERAKNKIAGGAVLHGESTNSRMRAIGSGWVYDGKYRPLQDEVDAILAVTLDDVLAVFQKYPFDPMTLVTLGP
ncbi:MAG: pitrilysin family protein [Planctomycetota bacterium]